ncbi:MAG: hypothetical protein M1339_04850 [Bacteroidetes bacterium]|nr:hypothetical protein [Bacteroidota bacterium]
MQRERFKGRKELFKNADMSRPESTFGTGILRTEQGNKGVLSARCGWGGFTEA